MWHAGPLAAGVLLLAIAVLGCGPSNVPSVAVSPNESPPPSAAASDLARPSVPASASPSTAGSTTFGWAARPEAFAGGEGTSLAMVAAGPAGLVALSEMYQVDGTRITRLWGSPDGVMWIPLDGPGLDEQHGISAVWGAGGSYWLVGQDAQTGDRASLWRSADARTWQPALELDPGLQAWSISDVCEETSEPASEACPLVLTGTVGVDGAIWRSVDGGDTWAKATVEDATGWLGAQDAAPLVIRGAMAISSGLLAFGNGLPQAEDTSGVIKSRFWRSEDAGATWSRLAHTGLFDELLVHDVASNGDVAVAVGEDASAPGVAVALASSDGGRTWSRATTPGVDAQGKLAQVFARGSGFVGLGFSSPADVNTFPVRESLWTSDDGASWRTGSAGALDGGIVSDAAMVDGRIVAVGRGWTTSDTGTLDAPFGPAVWTLAR
ncbi:MAG: repeat-like domain [Chloroflexota bacterium]|nr:repeat-like domain [Chloroflexota bacterium]